MEMLSELTPQQRWMEIVAPFEAIDGHEYRRTSPRVGLGIGGVQVAFVKDSVPRVIRGTALNASPGGLLLRLAEPIETHTLITVLINFESENALLCGTVVHSTQTVGAHKVGVKLQFPA